MSARIFALAIALAVAVCGATAGASPRIQTEDQDKRQEDALVRHLVDRAAAVIPLRLLVIHRVEDRINGARAYILIFDLSEVQGAPMQMISSRIKLEGDGVEIINDTLDKIAADLSRILANIREGREWNSRVAPPRTIGSRP